MSSIKKFMIAACATVAVLCMAVTFAQASAVVDVTESNFEEFTRTGLTMVMFYAPWCGHCKNLVPHWAEAADQLQGHAKFIKVDATVEQELASSYDVQGYPTIKVFQDGIFSDYEGGRSTNDLVSFVKRRLAPAVEIIRTAESKASLTGSDTVIVLHTTDESGDAMTKFTESANTMRDKYRFAAIVDASLFGDAKADSIVMMKPNESEHTIYSDEQSLADWIRAEAFPLVAEIGPDNYRSYIERGVPIAWLFYDKEEMLENQAQSLVLSSAKAHKSKLSFVYLDGKRYHQLLNRYGFNGENFPLFVIETDAHFWSFPEDQTVTEEAIEKFCNDYIEGKLKRTILSQPVPENPTHNGLTTIVAHSMEELVLNSDKDVMIEFYAPWCGHCKTLAPIYEGMAKKLAAVETVIIAKMDATANEVAPAFEVSGFPTIYFKPAGGSPTLYEGERSESDMLSFIKEHAKHPINLSEDEKEEL